MSQFRINHTTSDDQIRRATKDDIITALFTGHAAPLRAHRRRTWTKAIAIERAIEHRDSLRKG